MIIQDITPVSRQKAPVRQRFRQQARAKPKLRLRGRMITIITV